MSSPLVITPTPARTTTTPNAVMTSLATPSAGSRALSTWLVRMEPGSAGPAHTMDREQVWTVTAGALTVTANGLTETVTAGQTLVLAAETERRVRAAEHTAVPAEALVAMPADGQVSTPDQGPRPLPWAV